MVRVCLKFWRDIQRRFGDDGDCPLSEKHEVMQLHNLKRKGKSKVQIAVLPLLVLLWCAASLWLLMFNGLIRSDSADKSGDQVFPMRFLPGWSRATVDSFSEQTSEQVIHPQQSIQPDDQEAHSRSPDQAKTGSTISSLTYTISTNLSKSTAANSDEIASTQKGDDFRTIVTAHTSITDNSLTTINEAGSVEQNSGGYHESMNGTNKFKELKNSISRGNITVDQRLQSNSVGVQSQYEGISCDRSHWRTDICFVQGSDVSVKAKSVQLHSQDEHQAAHVVEKLKPYTRKWEKAVMENVDEVTIESIHTPSHDHDASSMECNVNYSAPAVIFSTGGYSGNVYHDFNDGLIPLYITTHHLHGEVVFLILEFHDWWFKRYETVLQQLSHYPVIDLSKNQSSIYCFKKVTVGLKIHNELSIDPQLIMDGVSIKDFRQMLQKAFIPSEYDNQNPSINSTANSDNSIQFGSTKKPRLVIIAREGSRSLTNQAEVIALAKKTGFQVKVIIPTESTKLEHIFRLLHSCDAMMGVHGAAMTHLLFMKPGTVFIQIIPLGTDYPALAYYGEPAMKLGLQYVEYKITAKESSLSQKYHKNDKVLTDPQAIASQDWASLKKYYLQGQSVRLSLPRFKPVLQKALQTIKLNTKKPNAPDQ